MPILNQEIAESCQSVSGTMQFGSTSAKELSTDSRQQNEEMSG